ncbi:unnamed protein product [Rotaria socialis]|uniref:Uncharacterized protein n=1 Tax=Rotaria socialis TaxID=392032 RepID=A0A819Z2F8_9BILA|nr:unnamed protein product [Rotaria socialis]CAF3302026.1 unnamed protein product [Rotaria socialis]CAF3313467.1 unnamed protein product [Rotaria socialis]CAF3384294.1 unnamed protein product [Rotaria socialis]CAF4163414.1 unnamed protein product [Rotaria socialis]
MGHFQPVLPLFKTNLSRRRARTWQILGLVVFIFLGLTLIAVRYLPTVVTDPVSSVLKNRDFKDIFVPPIPRPPVNWPNHDHDHSLHLSGDQSRLREKIHQNKLDLINLDENNNDNSKKIIEKPELNVISSPKNILPVENLTKIFQHMSIDELEKIQSAEMRREKVREADKYEYNQSSKGTRAGYGPPALAGTPPSPYFDAYGQVAPQGKMGKYGKYSGPNKSLYGADPMQQAMLLPPQSPAAMQAQAAAMLQMQQYMQGQGAGAQFAGILPPIQMPFSAAQQAGLLPAQVQPYFGFGGQQMGTPYFDPNTGAFQQQQQQQPGAFAPYQQPNFYDPSTAAMYAGPYGYMPAAF